VTTIILTVATMLIGVVAAWLVGPALMWAWRDIGHVDGHHARRYPTHRAPR
jgi:hypothetical protein